jgi:hypothetical protein
MLTFAPQIIRQTTILEIPRPIVSLRLADAWDVQRFKVPLRDGDILAGHSRNGTDIRLEGQIGSHEGSLKLDEGAMFDTLETLRAALHVESSTDTYILSLYHDHFGEHRYFEDCTTTRFDVDLSDKHLFSFQIHIHASQPAIQHGLLP